MTDFEKSKEILDYYGFGIKNILISHTIDNGKGYDTRLIGHGLHVFPDYAKFVEMNEFIKNNQLPYVTFALVVREDGRRVMEDLSEDLEPQVSMALFGEMGQILFTRNAYRDDEDDTNILVTHSPPIGTIGDKDLYNRILDLDKLKISCFGHVHGNFIKKKGKVTFIKSSIVDDHYDIISKPIYLIYLK